MRKKKLLYQSDFSLAKTGFGRCAKALLSYLYKTGKYEIIHYACGGMNKGNPMFKKTPWTTIGTLPDNKAELEQIQKDPELARKANYGAVLLDKTIEEYKPDVYIAAQDIWGVDFAIDKPWFNDVTSAIWTTLDSLPILPSALKPADKIKNYWIWSNFATKALHELGHDHVETMHGPLEDSYFKRLPDQTRLNIRNHFKIDPDIFMIGFVFRNQLRKSVPNLLEGYSIFKRWNPNVKSGLLLHTHFGEGWGIAKLAEEYNVPLEDIYTTYICKACKHYQVCNFTTVEKDCPMCGNKKSQTTTNVSDGVTENQLNDVYNLMDVYCHPFTSGGQEYPIQEAKLTELITLVTNYSCGEEMCEEEAASLPLEWTEYREHGTQFRKASTCPKSIARQLQKVYDMKPDKRAKMQKQARKWALDNYSISVIGKKFEEFIDSAPFVDYDKISIYGETPDPYCDVKHEGDNKAWLESLYKNVLKKDPEKEEDGMKHWLERIERGEPLQEIEKYFRQVAEQEKQNHSNNKKDFTDFLDKNDEGRRILYTMPVDDSNVFLSTSLFQSIKEQYPDHNLYVATSAQFESILKGNDFIHKVIPFLPQMENQMWLEGQGNHKGFFEIAFLAHIGTEKIIDYLHNGKDKIAFDIKG